MICDDLINIKVRHKVFGTGIVVDVSNDYFTVKFASKESKFVYPDAFERFLIADDESIQVDIIKEFNNRSFLLNEQHKAEEIARKAEKELCALKKKASFSAKKSKSIEEGFGPDYNVEYLSKHPILTYQQVEEQFGFKIAGFGRGINRTSSTVVLISSVDKKKSGFVYHDHWTNDGDYIYSGEGKIGDQQLTLGNKAIVEAEHDGKEIHLFVKLSPQEYYYQGKFSLVNYTCEEDKDESGNVRKEYKFRLRRK